MQTKHNQQDHQLDALLRQMQAPQPPTNFTKNVWRQIRLTEPEPKPSPFFNMLWLPKPLAYGLACIAIVAGITIGERAGRNLGSQQAEALTPILQPQTLAGIYLVTHSGR